jgi:hypothetical protein
LVVMGWQMETDAYRAKVLEMARSSPRFSGAELRYETRELLLFGVGEPTAALIALMDGAPSNIRISWHAAPYSLAELTSEVKRIMTASRGRLHTGGARHDGAGLTFSTDDRMLLEADDPQAALDSRYPVTIRYGEPVIPL